MRGEGSLHQQVLRTEAKGARQTDKRHSENRKEHGKTRRVFAALNVPAVPATAEPAKPPGPFPSAPALVAYMDGEGNDLLPAAMEIVPAIAEVRAALTGLSSCKCAGLSGAGPTCCGIFASAEAASAACETLRAAHPHWWVAATTLGG